jgi:signal transduction histidine kinase
MAARALRVSPLSLSAMVVVLAISIVAFLLTQHSSQQQERALLQSDTEQGAALAASLLGDLSSSVDNLATVLRVSNGSTAEFAAQAHALGGGPVTVVLARQQGGHYAVADVEGPGFQRGQVLGGPVGAAVSRANATLTLTRVVRRGDASTVGVAVGPPLVPAGDAIFVRLTIDPFTATPVTAGRPFEKLYIALYGSRHPASSNLFVATTRTLPLVGSVARAPVQVGDATWTLVTKARVPLNGSFASDAPLFFLLLGILVALIVGVTVEILVRRQRYAAALVAERTADLERSLRDLHEAQDALVRSERLSALGEMASVVGHELRNPLTAVTNALFLLRRELGEPTPPRLEGHLAMAERETDKAATLASDLTAFVRPREPVFEEVELAEVVREVIESAPPPDDVQLNLDVTTSTVRADRHQIAEVVTNLVTNAYQALPEGGSVHVGVAPNGSAVSLVVEDDGEGFGHQDAARVFEPFFTTKPNGTGLGLAIVRRLVEGHGGTIAVENVDPHGARVRVSLPADSATAGGR